MHKIAAALTFSSYAAGQLIAMTGSLGTQSGALTYDLTIFTDSGFTTPYDSSTHSAFKVGDPLYFNVKAAHPMARLDFTLLNCAVKSADQSLEYPIIAAQCPDTKVGASLVGAGYSTTELRAQYNVFEFIEDAKQSNNNQIHISCEVLLCDAAAGTAAGEAATTCQAGCQAPNTRRRRDASSEPQFLTLKSQPFTLN